MGSLSCFPQANTREAARVLVSTIGSNYYRLPRGYTVYITYVPSGRFAGQVLHAGARERGRYRLADSGKKVVDKQQKKEKRDEETHRTEDILGEILPPKEFAMENGQLWVQTVLSTPATRTEVVQLQEELDKRLTQRQAREIGICPIR